MCDVLIVDDDSVVREFIAFALEQAGIPFRVAVHGQQALEAVVDARPAVILLDMDMPVMNGVAFCEALDDEVGRASTSIVVMTASPQAPSFRAVCRADDALGKPFALDDLYAVIYRQLTRTE